jgi:MFS transporter, DHA1 family, multidrug resistance protein
MKIKTNVEKDKQKRQKYLGEKGLIILIAFLSAFIPLSTDLYLPALPRMAKNFHVSIGLLNLTIILFFVFYAVGALFWGPLSDKYGRKRILISGLVIYTAGGILCATAGNIHLLIACRVLQAIGTGAVTTVATAIVKDVYVGRKRVSILAVVQSMAMAAPITAPILGAFILTFTSWRGVFWTLTLTGLLALSGAIAMEETIGQRYTGNILQSISRLGAVLKNPGFTSLLITFSIIFIPMMAFISASSYIYIDRFGLGEQAYSFYFAANAAFSVVAPLLYIRLSKSYNNNWIIVFSYLVISVSGVLISTLGNINHLLFAFCLLPATVGINVIRPPYTHLLLEQQQEDTGAASSLISCGFTLFGSIGMTLISLNWANRIYVLGLIYVTIALSGLVLWLLISRRSFIHQVPHMTSN